MPEIQLIPVPGIPLIDTGDDLSAILIKALTDAGLTLEHNDVVVITSKIVSKAEGRWVDLTTVTPDTHALQIAEQCGKDPREVALILSESVDISRVRTGVLIVEHRLGFVSANAGIDHSNTRPNGDWRLLLPEEPDLSARFFRAALMAHYSLASISVVISDSHGRPFRLGTMGVAVGSAGLPALWDKRGEPDLFGHVLQHTEIGFADEIATAAGLVQGQAAEKLPVVIVRGLSYPRDEQASAHDLVRPKNLDLYR